MKIELTSAQRLIVATDFTPQSISLGRNWVWDQVLGLAYDLHGTGVYIKVNSALRACGYGLIDEIHEYGLGVFADLKLFDIENTLITDGVLLREASPDILTVSCLAGVDAMKKLEAELQNTEVLGITVLTNLDESNAQAMFACSVEESAKKLAHFAADAGIDGLISSAKEVEMLRAEFGDLLSLNTPAIRPSWAIVKGDDQNPDRIMTPSKAIRLGADRIVVGRPILEAINAYNAVMRTIEEIELALTERPS